MTNRRIETLLIKLGLKLLKRLFAKRRRAPALASQTALLKRHQKMFCPAEREVWHRLSERQKEIYRAGLTLHVAGETPAASRIFTDLGFRQTAIRCLLQAGDVTGAAYLYDEIGATARAGKVLYDANVDSGKIREAA